jgi:hypothetical protein
MERFQETRKLILCSLSNFDILMDIGNSHKIPISHQLYKLGSRPSHILPFHKGDIFVESWLEKAVGIDSDPG